MLALLVTRFVSTLPDRASIVSSTPSEDSLTYVPAALSTAKLL